MSGAEMPAILLSAQGLSAAYGARPLFEGVSFTVEEGDRIGLIGPNGAGKSTLLRTLADTATGEQTLAGLVSRRRGLRVGLLEQVPRFPAGATVGSVITGGVTEGDWEQARDAETVMVKLALSGAGSGPGITPKRRSPRCRAGGRSAWRSRASWPGSRICCCSTSRPTISTSRASCGWSACSRAAGSRPSR